MADINYIDLPEKTTPSVSGDKVLITDSEDGNLVKIQEALQFKGPQGEQGIQGVPGDNAPELEIEYSIDGVTSWHTPFTSGDFYQRVSTDGGVTWSSAIKFVGEDGTGTGDMLKSENLSGLANYATARTNLGLDTTANQTDSTDKRFMTDAQETKLDGIEIGAEVNNISDINATDLTDGGDSTLHYHSTDRNRANHTGTQDATTITGTKDHNFISDYDTQLAGTTNTTVFTPTADYHPATKKYVDDNAGGGSKQHRITIPGEQIADTSNYQGLYFYNDTGATITISNVAFAVGKAAAGSGAACACNIYKSSGTAVDGLNTNAVNLFTTAVDLGTGYTSLTNVPNTATVENGRWITLRVTSSAGATNKASDLQCIITYS